MAPTKTWFFRVFALRAQASRGQYAGCRLPARGCQEGGSRGSLDPPLVLFCVGKSARMAAFMPTRRLRH